MFEGSLYTTSMQSLILVIWSAYRTLDGPGFEPLISKALECDSFEGKEPPGGIFRHNSRMARSHGSRERVFRWSWTTWPDSCGAVLVRLFRRLPWVGKEAWAVADGWNSATVAPRPSVTAA